MSARPENSRHQLFAHPASPRSPVHEISVFAARDASQLLLQYRLVGDLEALLLPQPRDPVRADGLWRHTCFEAFIGHPPSSGYSEFNFSPSGEWAAYQFSGYRADMRQQQQDAAPSLAAYPAPDTFELTTTMDLRRLALPREGTIRLGVTAVIEDRAGGLSYWALKHPAEKPDFHHPDSFVIEL